MTRLHCAMTRLHCAMAVLLSALIVAWAGVLLEVCEFSLPTDPAELAVILHAQYERMKPAALRLRMAANNAPARIEVYRQGVETVDAVDNQDLFRQMDADKSGGLSPEELREELRKQGDEPEGEHALVSLFTEMDADGDGAITYAEAEAHESSMGLLPTANCTQQEFLPAANSILVAAGGTVTAGLGYAAYYFLTQG